MSDNEAPVEVIQGEARARLQAMADENSVELAYGAFQHRTATMITDVRKLLAYQSEAPAQGMSGDLHAILAGAHKVATGQVNDNGYEIKQRLDTVHRILEQALSLPLADREAIARVVKRYNPYVEDSALAVADAILALSGSLPPSPVGEGRETWASIAEWCEATFGPCTPYRIVSRAAEEMKELAEETLIDFDWSDKAREEVADVLICLSRVPGIWEAVEDKMTINRAREWRIMGDGTGYHVRAGNEPPTPAPVRGE